MNPNTTTLGIATISLLALGWCATEIGSLHARLEQMSGDVRSPGKNPALASAASTNLEHRLQQLEAATPGLAGVMAGMQQHFAKLHFASEARNWELARFERGEILEGLRAVATLRPEERGVNFAGIIDAFIATQMEDLKDAIDMKNRSLFRDAYRASIVMCNTCHQATGRPFITIAIPTEPPVTNQRWELTASDPKPETAP